MNESEQPRDYTHQPNRVLRCDCCEANTPHAITKSGDAYVCGICGNEIVYVVNNAPAMWAVK